MLNLGHMTEVPYPSQASLPEETPIIRMTNMAAFPMGSEVSTVPQRKSPIASGKSSSRSHSQSKSPVNAQPFNVSVIKPTKSAGSVGETGSRTPTSADRSPASSVTRLTPPVTNMVTAMQVAVRLTTLQCYIMATIVLSHYQLTCAWQVVYSIWENISRQIPANSGSWP
ncbi:hypothetical protein EB796_010431 [Bugula neritina]|uniref:Uncharacterized protein n=1 Tax=Bugula neritina TaxID=10212 RepID=A0A7J7JZ89_BUGNE|nr:hypothetical protein EB796_010431 [Bugula neritina]